MKKLHKRILVLAFLLSLSLSLSVPLIADPGAPGADPSLGATGSQDVGGSSSGVPLDGGVLEIIIAGVAAAAIGAVKKRRARGTGHRAQG
jgi:hypothetical protein